MSPTRSSSTSGSSTSIQPQPYLIPKASGTSATDFKSGEPIFGEITHADNQFIGRIRYVPHKDVTPERDEEGKLGAEEGDH